MIAEIDMAIESQTETLRAQEAPVLSADASSPDTASNDVTKNAADHPQVTIDPDIEALLPPLSSEEHDHLKQSIQRDGCREPLVVWKEENILLDGHNRHRICRELEVPFAVVQMKFADHGAALMWVANNQFGRRNLNMFQRAELALKLKPLLDKEAKKHMSQGGGDRKSEAYKSGMQILVDPIESDLTGEKLAKLAECSRESIRKVEVIKQHTEDHPELIGKLQRNEVSVDSTYNKVKEKAGPKTPKAPASSAASVRTGEQRVQRKRGHQYISEKEFALKIKKTDLKWVHECIVAAVEADDNQDKDKLTEALEYLRLLVRKG